MALHARDAITGNTAGPCTAHDAERCARACLPSELLVRPDLIVQRAAIALEAEARWTVLVMNAYGYAPDMDQFGIEDLVAAAREVRPHLTWLAPARAHEVGDELDAVLLAAEPDAAALASALKKDAAVKRYVEQYLFERRRPPDDGRGHGLMPTGHSSAVSMQRWRCPDASCDHDWHQLELGEPIERCPKHDLELVRG
jgi:hypothetical protein